MYLSLRARPERGGLRIQIDRYLPGRAEPGLKALAVRGWSETWLAPGEPLGDAIAAEAVDIGKIE